MNFDSTLYKSFFILGLKENLNNLFQIDKRTHSYEEAGKKIIITEQTVDNNIRELVLLWETIKEIKSEKIGDFGAVITDIEYLKEVNKSFIWVFDDTYPYIFVFTKKIMLLRDIQQILLKQFNIQTYNITFNNNFFNFFFNSHFVSEVQSATFQTNEQDLSSITIQGTNIQYTDTYNDIAKQDSDITSMTVVLKNHSRVRIYKNSKIILYNSPSKYEILEILSYVRFVLSAGGDLIE